VWDVSIIDTAIKDFYNKSMDTMVEALKMNLTVSILEQFYADQLVSSIQFKGASLVSKRARD